MSRQSIILAAIFAAGAYTPSHAASPPGTDQVTLTANPGRVCRDDSVPAYLNFDLVIRNGSESELRIEELRASVLDTEGQVVERRLVWQQALEVLAPDRSVPAGGEALIFNPLHFRSGEEDSRIRYEVTFAGQAPGAAPLALTIAPEDCTPTVPFSFPLRSRTLVYDGYDFLSHHRRTGYGGPEDAALGLTDNFQRFGVDLVVVDEAGRIFQGDGASTEEWLGWGLPVLAARAGTVAAIHDGQPDNVAIGTVDRWTDRDLARNPMTSYGNYVLIDHGGGEFTLYAHLRQGSVAVAARHRVKAGQAIGSIGNSGASGGVHLHFERRSGPGIAGVRTLPPYFGGIRLAGAAGRAPDGPVSVNSGDVIIAR